jgi:hypothetical protein
MEIRLNLSLEAARRIVLGLLVFNFLLVVIYLGNLALPDPSQFIQLLFDLDSDRSLPTWFSSIQLFVVGQVFLFVAYRRRQIPPEVSSHFPLSQKFLVIVGLVFVFFSMDETAMFHERLKFLLGGQSWIPRFEGDLGLWMSVYAAAGLVLLIILWRDVWRLVRQMPRAALFLALGFGVFFVGGVVMEALANLFLRGEEATYLDYLQIAAEEGLEMAGISIMLYGAVLLGRRLSPSRAVTEADGSIPVPVMR